MSIRGFFSRLLGRNAAPAEVEVKPSRDAKLHPEALAVARRKLEEALTVIGAAEHIPGIDEIVIAEYRVLYQMLPVRVYLYGLGSAMGRWEFESMCDTKRPAGAVLETGTFDCAGSLYGYYLYSLQPIGDYESRKARAGVGGAHVSRRSAHPDDKIVSLEGTVEEVADALLAPTLPKTFIDEIVLSSEEALGRLFACLMLRKHEASLEKEEIVRFVERNRTYLDAGVLDPVEALIEAAREVEGSETIVAFWSYFMEQVAHARAGALNRIDIKSDRLFWLVYAAAAQLSDDAITYRDAVALFTKPENRDRISPRTLQFMLFDYVEGIGTPHQPPIEYLLLVVECALLSDQHDAARAALSILAGLPFPRRASISADPFKRAGASLEASGAMTDDDRAVMHRLMARFQGEVTDDDL